MRSEFRLGVDAGGTFTDFVLADTRGQVKLYKALSTPKEPTQAIENGLRLISEDIGRGIRDIVSNCDLCINGTTVALNALIEHKGAKVGLLCTSGHEDSIEIRLGHKEDGYRYDPVYPPAKMIVPRYLRRGIPGRLLATGEIREVLDESAIVSACELFKKEGVESVAISFLWACINGAHEERAAELVRQEMPGVYLTVGSQLYPQVREYTRTSTAVVNAYLGPTLKKYVDAVDEYFKKSGAQYPVRYFQSNGGLAIGNAMSARSVYAVNSGPASAPQAGAFVTRPFNKQNIITVDMGGTSFDITLTKGGSANINRNIDFLRYRIGVPMIQVETLGAGGGSIGWVDELGLLRMGPHSAGADPGPACYGKGGKEPTVSDANLILGYLNPKGLVGGTMPLDANLAYESIKSKIAEPLGISVEKAAYGMYTIVNNNMVNGIRRVSVERGYDPRDFVLVGAGGAIGAHITAIATEMGIDEVIVSKLASGLCAYGQILSDVKYNYMGSVPIRLEDKRIAAKKLNEMFDELESKGINHLHDDGFDTTRIRIERTLEMRYVGQIHECSVKVDKFEFKAGNIGTVTDAFHSRYHELYTYSEPESPVEIVNIESTLYGEIERPTMQKIAKGKGSDLAKKGLRELVISSDGSSIEAGVYEGELLGAEDVVKGPAVIEEGTQTIVVQPDWLATLDDSGSYRMQFRPAPLDR